MILFSVPEPYLLMQPLPRAVWEGYPEWERWTQRRSRWSWLSQRRRLTASSGGSSEDLSYPNPWRHEGKTEAGRESQDKDTDQNMLYHNSRRRHFFCKCIPSLDGFLFRCCHLYLHYLGFVCVESFVQVFFSFLIFWNQMNKSLFEDSGNTLKTEKEDLHLKSFSLLQLGFSTDLASPLYSIVIKRYKTYEMARTWNKLQNYKGQHSPVLLLTTVLAYLWLEQLAEVSKYFCWLNLFGPLSWLRGQWGSTINSYEIV